MRHLVRGMVAGAAVVTAIAACDDGGGAIDCTAACEKSRECAKSPETFNDTSCRSGCEGAKSLVQDGFQSSLMTCLGKDCSDQQGCVQEAAKECEPPPNFSDFVDALCAKTVECQPGLNMLQCVAGAKAGLAQSGGEILNCLNDVAISALDTCLGTAVCPTFQHDIETCLGAALGLDLSGSPAASAAGADAGR